MQFSTGNIVKGLNTVLDKATELNPDIPFMISPFTSNYLSMGKAAATVQWLKIFGKANWRDGDIIAPQDAVGAGWIDEDDLEDIWMMYYFAVSEAEADLELWANCENFTSAVADTFASIDIFCISNCVTLDAEDSRPVSLSLSNQPLPPIVGYAI